MRKRFLKLSALALVLAGAFLLFGCSDSDDGGGPNISSGAYTPTDTTGGSGTATLDDGTIFTYFGSPNDLTDNASNAWERYDDGSGATAANAFIGTWEFKKEGPNGFIKFKADGTYESWEE
ncbi:MAG: hypothetical protein LBT68_00175 [Spirochaetales bacterium]|jgi:hypothetical protein|nr:hypothetical protein [Spirochaetales bacterium]